MWLFTKKNFISVVAYDPKADRKTGSPFTALTDSPTTHVLVRARLKEDLNDLLRVAGEETVIDDQPSADYRFRMVIPREDYKAYLNLSVDELLYTSHFKEEFKANAPSGNQRYSALMSVWSIMARFQPTAPYGGSPLFQTASGARVQSSYQTSLWDSFEPEISADLFDEETPEVEGALTLQDAFELLSARGEVRLTPEEINDLDEDAFELYLRLAEKVGVGMPFSRSQIRKVHKALRKEIATLGGVL
jgi:hypothetical protein